MTFTEAERETLSSIEPRGFHINNGTPCECGGDAYSTYSKLGYSDSKVYYHECDSCGNKFSTWIEG